MQISALDLPVSMQETEVKFTQNVCGPDFPVSSINLTGGDTAKGACSTWKNMVEERRESDSTFSKKMCRMFDI